MGSNVRQSQVVISSSDRQVRVYDASTLALCSTCHGHKDTVTSLITSKQSDSIFYTSSSDKCVAMWDVRVSDTPIGRLRFADEVLSVAVNNRDALLAAACGEEIAFYDIRKLSTTAGAPRLGSYTDLHSNTVTNLLFSQHQDQMLISGGEDGLVCVCDTSSGESEEAVVSVLNVDCATRRIGVFGPDYEGVYCLSTVEDASFWHYPSAQRVAQFPNLREQQGLDYLVDCHYHNEELMMIGGNYDGKAVMMKVEPSGYSSVVHLADGHTEMLRCSHHLRAAGVYLTGAEDGQIIAWKATGMDALCIDAPTDPAGVDEDKELQRPTEEDLIEDIGEIKLTKRPLDQPGYVKDKKHKAKKHKPCDC